MNKRKAKELRAKAADLAAQWLRSVVPPEEVEKITAASVKEFEKGQESHVYANGQLYCSAYSTRFFYKRLKRATKTGVHQGMFLIPRGQLG